VIDRLRLRPAAVTADGGRWSPLRLSVVVFVSTQLLFAFWWLGQWPAMLSYDSLRYVQNVTTGPWTADHSPLYDSLVLASLSLTNSVALLAGLQTTVAALALTYVAQSMRRLGIADRWIVIPALVVALGPASGVFVSTVWKDVPFTLAQVFLLGTLIRILAARRAVAPDAIAAADPTPSPGRVPNRLFWAIGVELTIVVLSRNNGFLIVAVIGIALVVALTGTRRKVLIATAAAFVALVLAQTVVYPVAGIAPASSNLAYGVFYADIAVAYGKEPGSFTQSDLDLMASVAPLEHWALSSNCVTSDPLFKQPFSIAKAATVSNQLAGLWVRQFFRTPGIVIGAKLCRSSIAWNVWPSGRDSIAFVGYPQAINEDLFGRARYIPADVAANLRPHPVPVFGAVAKAAKGSQWNPVVQTLFFRGSVWSYVSYVAVGLLALRLRRRDVLVLASLCLANQLSVMAANPAQLFRYMIAPVFVGTLSMSLFACGRAAPRVAASVEPDSVEPHSPEPSSPEPCSAQQIPG
jgi:hypothetical protein